ncbi:alpha-L-rhamnosidase N-terminal domain-containing protein [Actinoplanes sp. NPDC051633]|uniref:glycoside hydrolase family 78 protein n=1 Tax=Actinoplanes sp. NPDC051633 TaxID=3155670 RepID=UPI0034144CA1
MTALPAPTPVRFEHHTDAALGIGTAEPRLSWQLPSAGEDYRQQRYEIEIDGETYAVDSPEQLLVPWPGPALESRQAAQVRVRVNDSPWSEPATVEAGLLHPGDWTARFVSPPTTGDGPVIAGEIDVPGDVVKARLYASAHGIYIPTLNGERVGDHQLAPGWTCFGIVKGSEAQRQ